MKKLLIVIGCLAAGAVEARQQNLAQLAPSQFADTEVSTNAPCALDLPPLKEYRIGLGLVGTPSNNVEVALGHDADGAMRFYERGGSLGSLGSKESNAALGGRGA